MTLRNLLGRRRFAFLGAGAVVALLLTGGTGCVYRLVTDPAVLAVWWIGIASLGLRAYGLIRSRRLRSQPMANGRIVAVVTAHEQDPVDLHACVGSILNQRGVVVEEVHVVDEGSTGRPVQPFPHPRVHWHRAAATHVLDRMEPDYWDFVLIVDGDCLLDPRSIERQLRAFSRTRVMATVGMVTVRNFRQNLLTRIADLDVSSFPPQVSPGTPVLYRAAVPFRHRHRRLAAGALTMCAAAEGEVAGVPDAVASATAPADLRAAYRQRLDWSTSWWRAAPLALARADRRLPALVRLVIAPLTISYAVAALTLSGWRPLALYAGLYLLTRYAATVRYVTERRLRTWLLLTPVEAFCHLVFLVPVKYLALIRLCMRTAPSAPPMPPRGTVYYAGYLPEGNGS